MNAEHHANFASVCGRVDIQRAFLICAAHLKFCNCISPRFDTEEICRTCMKPAVPGTITSRFDRA